MASAAPSPPVSTPGRPDGDRPGRLADSTGRVGLEGPARGSDPGGGRAADLPQVFGRYVLLRRLSRGGMGEIFLGRLGEIQGFEKPVIIKKVLPQLAEDQQFVKRFIDEAQVAIKLNHANIAPVYEVGKVDGEYFLALEYVEGRDLRRLSARCAQERQRLPPDLCLYVARELASGLGYAHRRTDAAGQALSLVHCDISPPNVMISFEGEVKIIDFGIAKSALRTTGTNPAVGFGKFGYMAPEQLRKGGMVDRRTDIYAAGVVLYELLTGERLYQFPEGAGYHQMALIVTRGEFVPPSQRAPGLDPSLDAIVGRALATRPADRYQSGEEFRDALSARLSQMNPTISADALAGLMRSLFADEIIEERALIEQTRAVDVGEYKDQLAGSAGHTVTFARAGLVARRTAQLKAIAAPIVAPGAHRTALLAGLAAVALLAGGGMAYLALRPAPRPRVALPARPSPAASLAVTLAAPAPAPAVPLAAAARPEPPPPPRPSPPAISAGARRPVRRGASTATPVVVAPAAPRVEEPEERLARVKGHVQPKFQSLNKEYREFQSRYGSVFDVNYGEILGLLRPPGPNDSIDRSIEKYQRLDALIDRLEQDMKQYRSRN